MEKVMEILKRVRPDVDFTTGANLIEDGILDSVDVVAIVSEIEDEFNISIEMEYIQPGYFQSPEAIWGMIEEHL